MHRQLLLLALVLLPGWTQPTCAETTGQTVRSSYRSVIATTTMYYTVYLPPCFNDASTYPTVYLLHGSASYDDHWLQLGLDDALNTAITAGDLPPMIAVLPYGEWIANENRFDQLSFERVFLEELLPDVEANYPVSTEAATRAIGGISRGGFWAFSIGFRHPEMFSAVGGHSAFFDPFNAPPENNPLDLALNAPDINQLDIYLDRGADDYAYAGLDQMDANLSERGVDYTYVVNERGEHNNNYWRDHVTDYLAFYATSWRNPSTSLDPTTFAYTPPRDIRQQDDIDPEGFTFTPPRTYASTVLAHPAGDLFVPAVAFPAAQARLSRETLDNVLAGLPDERLVLDEPTAAALRSYGVPLHESIRVLQPDEIDAHLWQNRRRYTILPFNELTPRLRTLHVGDQHPILDAGYPLFFESDAPNYNPNSLTRLTLSGVTAMTRDSIRPIDNNGVGWAADGISAYTTAVDIFHTSNEVSFTANCPARTGGELGAFCSKDAHFEVLERVGLDVVELSGNHNNDFGYEAYLRTLAMYNRAGIATIGGGATVEAAQTPLILNHAGNSIAMLACNDAGPYYAVADDQQNRPGAASCVGDWLPELLPTLQAEHDLVIVTVQHVEFEEYTPRPEIQFDFRQIADWGADVVVGTHAHKPQTFEFYPSRRGETALLHFGLGNLFFDQPWWGNSRFWMDTLYIYEGELLTVDLFTGIIDGLARPRPMTAEEQQNFLDFMFIVQGGM